jgi:2-C-methyl-D-erythritol 2,4-cyclodiphosphate synthase
MIRIGIGYDIHKLVLGRDLILAGVKVPHSKGLSGHSDADVIFHAVADAILGSVSEGDIGKHFPDSDENLKGISSGVIVEKAVELLGKHRGKVGNVDIAIIAGEPRLSTHVDKMKSNLANLLGVSAGSVSIKCSSNNGMGVIGEGEGIACIATCLVELG